MPYLDDMNGIWEMVKDSIRSEMPDSAVNLWFGPLKIVSFEENNVNFTIESEFKYDKIHELKYNELIEKHFSEILGFPVKITIKFVGTPVSSAAIIAGLRNSQAMSAEPEHTEKPKLEPGSLIPYNFEYTFDNFIVGNSNKFAHAACFAVANAPAKDYNPLFIYGPSGLGKTHLMYAVTNKIKDNNPNVRILYIKGDDFTNQMVDYLSRQAMKEFRDKYRSCDVLLIDDIQFIAGKVATQEEFFHTFNALYEEHKQIILTSDRPPREIKTLEDRLVTRFEWGLIADIQPPDLELRVAIIKKKAEQINVELPNDVLIFLAENLRSNIRQIEGAIKKLGAKSFLSGMPVSMETAKICISELLGGAEPVSVTVDKIFAMIFKKYGIKKDDLVGAKRNKEIAFARHVAIYMIREVTEMSLPNIGKTFNRNHATVLSSIEVVEKKLLTDSDFKSEIESMKREIGNGRAADVKDPE